MFILIKKALIVCFSPAIILVSSVQVELDCLAVGNRCKLKSSFHYHHSAETKDALRNSFTPSITSSWTKA